LGEASLSATPDPEHRIDTAVARPQRPSRRVATGHLESGIEPFRDLIADTPQQYQPALTLMADWAERLVAANPAIKAETYFGTAGDVSLLPRFKDENIGLVSMWALPRRQAIYVILAKRLRAACTKFDCSCRRIDREVDLAKATPPTM
jgi:hypothetical protein